MSRHQEPILFCFVGPAGSGKSSLCEKLAESDSSLYRSISTTSRKPRLSEENNIDYHFVSREEFEEQISKGAFLEYASFGGNYYGSSKGLISAAKKNKQDLLFDIDVQGAEQVKQLFPKQTVVLFVFPPSTEILEQRLRARGQDSEERIKRRMEIAVGEIEQLKDPTFSDFLLINDSFDQAVEDAKSIISSERMRLRRLSDENRQKLFF